MNLVASVNRLRELALDFLFPPSCVGCGARGYFICPRCRSQLPRIRPPLCVRCGLPLPPGDLCQQCAGDQMQIDGIRSLFRYEGAARRAIIELKYHNVKALASPLARSMARYLSASGLPADTLVAVPLHPRRLRQRGYNQSYLLARELGRLSSLPVSDRALVRRRNTPPQAKTDDIDQRHSNMADAFACNGREVADRRVLLIDDVCTSGATLESCAAALRAAGAASVWGLTLAREV